MQSGEKVGIICVCDLGLVVVVVIGEKGNFSLEEVGQWKWERRTRTTYDVFVEGREKGNCHLPFDTDSYSFQSMSGRK